MNGIRGWYLTSEAHILPNQARWRNKEQPRRYQQERENLTLSRHKNKSSQVRPHRVDRMYYMAGTGLNMSNKYQVDENEFQRLREMASQRKSYSHYGRGLSACNGEFYLADTTNTHDSNVHKKVDIASNKTDETTDLQHQKGPVASPGETDRTKDPDTEHEKTSVKPVIESKDEDKYPNTCTINGDVEQKQKGPENEERENQPEAAEGQQTKKVQVQKNADVEIKEVIAVNREISEEREVTAENIKIGEDKELNIKNGEDNQAPSVNSESVKESATVDTLAVEEDTNGPRAPELLKSSPDGSETNLSAEKGDNNESENSNGKSPVLNSDTNVENE